MGEGAEPTVGGWRQLEGEPGGSCAFKSLSLCFFKGLSLCLSRPFPLLSKGFPGQKCSSDLCALSALPAAGTQPGSAPSSLPPLHGMGTHPARAAALPKPAAPPRFGEEILEIFFTHISSCPSPAPESRGAAGRGSPGWSKHPKTPQESLPPSPLPLSVLENWPSSFPRFPRERTALPSLPLCPHARKPL